MARVGELCKLSTTVTSSPMYHTFSTRSSTVVPSPSGWTILNTTGIGSAYCAPQAAPQGKGI